MRNASVGPDSEHKRWGFHRLRPPIRSLAAVVLLAATAAIAAAGASYATEPLTVTKVSPDAGLEAGGTEVTITGTEFAEAAAVKFGETTASFKVNSPTSITATAPAHTAGTVDVTVEKGGATSSKTTADQFTYVAAGPAPTVEKLSPKKGPAAGGTSVTITGTSFKGVTAVKFGAEPATSYTVSSETSITAVSPSATSGDVEVTVTTPNGLSGITKKDRFKYENPTVLTVSPSAGPVGGGTPVTITGTGFAPGTATTAFVFGKGVATSVKCASTTECTMVSPAALKAGVVDVTARVGNKKSKKAATDKFTYS